MQYCSKKCADRAGKLIKQYGVTTADVYAIYKEQSGRCAICDTKGDIHELGFKTKQPFHIDHDHYSGKVRGLLCAECNKGLGMFKDNRLFLSKAIEYLTSHSGDNRESEETETSESSPEAPKQGPRGR